MKNLRQLLTLSTPILLGYVPIGMTFGFLMKSAGYDWWLVLISSVFVFSGAMQFFSISLFLDGASMFDVALATFVINFRHIFYGMSIFHLLPDYWLKKLYFIHAITDESYSLLTSEKSLDKHSAVWLMMLNQSYWVIGSLIGAMLASTIDPIKGIDFAMTTLFFVLLIEQLKSNRDFSLPALALLACVLSTLLFPNQFLVAATLSCCVLLWLKYQFAGGKHE